MTISIDVDAESARIFGSASAEYRRKLELLLSLRLRELTTKSPQSLRAVMDETGSRAESRGLTPEILDSLLRDE